MNPIKITLETELDDSWMQEMFAMIDIGVAYWATPNVERFVDYRETNGDRTVALHIIEDEVVRGQDHPRELAIDAAVINRGIERILQGDVHAYPDEIGEIVKSLNTGENLIGAELADTIVQAGLYGELIWG
jgi:hypothetical protein